MDFNYIQDIIRSGIGEEAALIKEESTINEWGDSVLESEESYRFKTVVDQLNRAELEEEIGDHIEGDIRFYVSEECNLKFEHGDIIVYQDRRYNVDTVRQRTLGEKAMHKEIIAESV